MPEETQTNQPATPPKRTRPVGSRIIITIIVLAIVLGAGYYLSQNGGFLKVNAVATVNGEKIKQPQYDEYFNRLTLNLKNQGQNTESEEIKSQIKAQAIDSLISETLVIQKAVNAGIAVTDAEINEQINQVQKQFPSTEEYDKALETQGFTPDSFRLVLNRQMVIQKYIDANADFSSAVATKEEVETLYDQLTSSNKDIPKLDTISAQLEGEIIQQKKQAIITQLIKGLRDSSTVEVLI